MRRFLPLTALILAGLVLLAACGSSGDSSSSSMGMSDNSGTQNGANGMDANSPVVAGAREIPVEAGALTFTPKRLQLTAGEDVTIVMTSIDIAHDFYVAGVGHVVHAPARKTAKGGLMIDKAGTYKFWCRVKGHKAGGMVGTIVVTA
jgi:plastocyanin